jgi:hypothetical protein
MGDPVPVSFGRGSNKGRFGQIGQCAHINAYVEDLGEAGKTAYSAVSINGQDIFATLTGAVDVAGMAAMLPLDDVTLLAVMGRNLFIVGADGSNSIAGGIPSDGFVTMARNRKTPNAQIAIVRDGVCYIYSAGTLAPIGDPDLPPPVSVFEVQGYFVFPIADGRFFLAGPNATSVDPLDLAEAEASADSNVMGIGRGRTIIIFGAQTTEFWDPNGNVTFPFGFTTAANFGCYAAGSVAKMPIVQGKQAVDTIVLAATDHDGSYLGVVILDGYTPTIISTSEVDRAIAGEPDKNSIRAMGLTENGRPVYIITGSTFTYGYDSKSQQWHQRKSAGLPRWRASCYASFAGKILFGDYASPKIYRSDVSLLDEAGSPIVWQIQLPPIHMWPAGFKVNNVWVDMVTGVGLNSGVEDDDSPELVIDYSKDGGDSWAAATRHSLGAMAQRFVRVKRRALGRFDHNGVTLRLTCSARVARGLQQVAIDADQLKAA